MTIKEKERKELMTEIGALQAVLENHPDDAWSKERLAKAKEKLRRLEEND